MDRVNQHYRSININTNNKLIVGFDCHLHPGSDISKILEHWRTADCAEFVVSLSVLEDCEMSRPKMIEKDADEHHDDAAVDVKKKRTFRKFSYRGIDLDKLLDLSSEQLMDLVNARPRRRFQRGLKRKPMGLIKKLRQAKKDAPAMEKPAVVKTHLRNMIVVPEMIGSIVGVYNGKTFNQVEIKPEMIGHYLGEFSITYKPVKHGRPGIGATHSSRFIPLK
ncbi:hypothetical protein KVV02_007623 [Mortierella alpina]|uniref:40S ribosomal protein S15 n=1 Tax=Mortierella alpina TaxID=64518 RepID=A0A9P8CUT3_MORAP|nr:hypothetical protein KVV02_007623 [Mortierella alpina]